MFLVKVLCGEIQKKEISLPEKDRKDTDFKDEKNNIRYDSLKFYSKLTNNF